MSDDGARGSPGMLLGEYLLVEPLPTAGLAGECWLARHEAFGDHARVWLPPPGAAHQQLIRIATRWRRLSHPSIVRVLGASHATTPAYLVTEHLPGCSLHQRLQQGPLPASEAQRVVTGLAGALQHAHRQGIAPVGLTPLTVWLDPDGRPRLTGFGMAGTETDGLQHSLDLEVSPAATLPLAYQAPECRQGGPIDGRADLFSLGVLLFEMLTGQLPAAGDLPSDLAPGVPASLDELYRSCCAHVDGRDPALLDELSWESGELPPGPASGSAPGSPRVHGVPAADRPAPPPPGGRRRRRRPAWLSWVTLLLVLMVLVSRQLERDDPPLHEAPHAMEIPRSEGRERFPIHIDEESGVTAGELPGFSYVDRRLYSCGNQTYRVARYRHERTGLVFCLIPGGRFTMGSPSDEPGRHPQEPQRTLEVQPFLLCQTECTQVAWDVVQAEGGPKDARSWHGGDRPIEGVSWLQLQPFLRETGLRLPTEVEWEFACRAGCSSSFGFGADERQLHLYGWTYEQSAGQPAPVARKRPNAFGLFDMHGNVWEWCQEPIAGGDWRVLKGGAWNSAWWNCRSAARWGWHQHHHSADIGFRPAASLN